MIVRRLFLGLAGAALLGTPVLARTPEARHEALDAAMRQLVEGNSTPGIVALILRDGRPVYERAMGMREAGGSTPIGLDDMFRLASMTKVFTSVTALMLVEEGRIGLDDPIDRHLPEFANLRMRQQDGTLASAPRTPTVRELMSHTSGFSYNFMNSGVLEAYRAAGVTDGLGNPEVTTEEAMRRLATAPLLFAPGSAFHYSLSTDVLGAVVERVTGRPLGSIVAERIARPLGLESLMFRVPQALAERFVPVTRPARPELALGLGVVPVRAAEAVPFPATRGEALLDPNRAFSATAYHSGGGGMSGNIRDYARFLTALARGGELDGVRILRPETVRLITENATGSLATLRGPGWGHSLGAGVLLDPAAARSRLPAGSWGWGGIYGTQFWVDPVGGVVGVVMTQTAIIGSGPISNLVREAFYAE
jgi:CubicO group peptidase (beta-lactamase class C family)